MPGRPAFIGLRREFLESQRASYAAAVDNGTKEDCGKDILRRYFKRFPPELPHNQEPSAAWLAAVNDALPDREPAAPNPCDYPEDQTTYYALEKAFNRRQDEVKFRSAQVLRWLAKQPKECSATDPLDFMAVMKRRLLGKLDRKPRKPIAHQIWGKLEKNKPAIDAAYAKVCPRKGHLDINVWNQQAKVLFELESQEVQKRYERIALQQHKAEVEAWNAILKLNAPIDAQGRQTCIDGITDFLQPILNMVVDFTGMRLTLMMGGPEPADHGRLNIISIHAGHTQGNVKMTFGEAESESYQSQIVPVFSNFLRKCYTREDCVAASLNSNTTSLVSALTSQNVTYCAAAGENYGPADDQHGKLSQPAQDTTSCEEPSQSSSDREVSADGEEPAGEDKASSQLSGEKSNVENSSGRRSSSKMSKTGASSKASAKAKDCSSTNSSSEGRHAEERNSSSFSACSSGADAGAGDEDIHTPPFYPLRHSSPASDCLAPSPVNSQPASPTPMHGLDTQYHEAQVGSTGDIASGRGLASSPSMPAIRFGPPGRRSGPAKTWRMNPCRRAPKPVSLNSRSSAPISRPPTAAARLLVPLDTVPPLIPPPKAPSNNNSHIAAPTAQVAIASAASASNPQFPSPGAPHPDTAPSAHRMRTRRQAEGTFVAAEQGSVGMGRTYSNKENISGKTDRVANEEAFLGRGGKRKSAAASEAPPAKRLKVTYISSATAPVPLQPLGQKTTRATRGRPSSSPSPSASSPSPSTSPSLSPSTSPSLSPSTSLSSFSQWALPPDAPAAIKQTLQLVRLGAWGKNWDALVTAWLEFEATRGYPADQRLGCKHRPPAVSEWIQRARSPTYRPAYKTNDYQTMFWKWWAFLQPEWRDVGDRSASMDIDGGWDALNKAGANGLASVMAALFFWGFAVEEEGEGEQSWNLAVADVCWVLQQMK